MQLQYSRMEVQIIACISVKDKLHTIRMAHHRQDKSHSFANFERSLPITLEFELESFSLQ
jgi:hypothetical protein